MVAYLLAKKIAIAVATTFGEQAFDEKGEYKHPSHQDIFAAIRAFLAPDDPPPPPGP